MSQMKIAGTWTALTRINDHQTMPKRSKRRGLVRYLVDAAEDDYTLDGTAPSGEYNNSEYSGPKQTNLYRNNNNEQRSVHLLTNDEGLVVPRKLVNPCSESLEHRDLRRELLFNNKLGKNVLNQKSELQKALEKQKKQLDDKETKLEQESTKTPFERMLEERARRLEELERDADENENTCKSEESNEFLKVHARLRGKLPVT